MSEEVMSKDKPSSARPALHQAVIKITQGGFGNRGGHHHQVQSSQNWKTFLLGHILMLIASMP